LSDRGSALSATVFYSWQSDLPNATNRGLIEEALKLAAKSLRADESLRIEPVIERDTLGLPGSPEIHTAIFEKIETAAAFVADVTIIGSTAGGRPTPNPNVLLELGYALRALSEERVVLVVNIAFGGPEALPFDLKMRRVLKYSLDPHDANRTESRKALARSLENALKPILQAVERASGEISAFKQSLLDDSKRIEIDDRVNGEAGKLRTLLDSQNLETQWSGDALRERVAQFEASAAPLVAMFAVGNRWAPSSHADLWRRVMERVANPVEPRGAYIDLWHHLQRYPALRLMYAGGIAAVGNEQWLALRKLLVDVQVRESGRSVPSAIALHAPDLFGVEQEKHLPGMAQRRAALADHLFASLQEPLVDQFPTSEEIEAAFDRFEALVALVHADLRTNELWEWCPLGRLVWRPRTVFDAIGQEAAAARERWPPLQAGLFSGDYGRFESAMQKVRSFCTKTPSF